MLISKKEKLALCAVLAEKLTMDWIGYAVITPCEDDNEAYDSDTQDKYNDFYGIIWETLENE